MENLSTSDLIIFLAGAFIGLASIGVTIYLYLQQQRKDLDRKYDQIINNLRLIHQELTSTKQELSSTKEKVANLDQSTSGNQHELIVTQGKLLSDLVEAQINLAALTPTIKDPTLAQKLKTRSSGQL